jgi:hypothetical protein
MLEAFAPRNPTLVTLIREKKRFEDFSPNDVLGRILTHELMDKEIQHRKKIGELEAKLNNLKVKEVALVSWNSGDEISSEEEGKKVTTVAIKKLPSISRLFNNLTDDEESSCIHCFMTKGEKVKIDSKTSPPPSDESEMDSSDESIDEEANQLVSDMD